MKSNCKKEDAKKKYVFFSDPDVTDKFAETRDAPIQTKQMFQAQQQCHTTEVSAREPAQLPVQLDLKSLEHLLSYHPIQPYPFTFISAVKRKLALGDHTDVYKKLHDPYCMPEEAEALNLNDNKNLYHVVQKMNFIRPLKAPDLKISPKTLDLSNRENSMSKELSSSKFDILSKELIQEKIQKSTKLNERVQRKLDFSSEGASLMSNDSIEPLKVPNVSIASNLSKKKEHIRESSREKENRSKRIKKDESLLLKRDDMDQDVTKKLRTPQYFSRKNVDSITHSISDMKSRTDKSLFHTSSKENDFGLTKLRSKNFATSTAKKDTDKKYKSYSVRSAKLSKDNSLDSKSRAYSNEFFCQSSIKVPENITIRESTKNFIESTEHRHNEDEKHICSLETRQMKQHKMVNQVQSKLGNGSFKEQIKWPLEKTKQITNKTDDKHHSINSEELEGAVIMESNAVIQTHNPCSLTSVQFRGKESEKPLQNLQTINTSNFDKNSDGINYVNTSTLEHSKKDAGSVTESSTTLHKPTSTNTEGDDLNDSTFSEALLDPRRISFRDENRSQTEFCDLVTPDVDLINRVKRKKPFVQENGSEPEALCTECHPVIGIQTDERNVQLLHPSALHMQFQTELHLLDSFNESIRRVMDVEKCLCSVKNKQEREQYKHKQTNEDFKSRFSTIKENSNVTDSEYFCGNANLNRDITKGAGERPTAENQKAFADDEAQCRSHLVTQPMTDELEIGLRKTKKRVIQVVEVQTQTVNDIATQTDIYSIQDAIQNKCSKTCGITREQASAEESEMLQLSLDSAEQFEDLDQIDEISLPSKIRTLSEISLHETTSSIRTETGTEISISTRDVTCSFNKYLDLEIAQLIKDEKQRFDKIEMLFKSREKTLNDRTKKLVKLEEQKRALRDTGQDSRISSVKKKQRALLLKLQQEKDEMNRLKELHKIASQERKLMLQKQRNMFNPQMSTKNILTKLKRSADSQSPRRLSGPMKGYDIRSNSSMSSLVDSDKSQHDQSQADTRLHISDNDIYFSKLDLSKGDKFTSLQEESNTSLPRCDKSSDEDALQAIVEDPSKKLRNFQASNSQPENLTSLAEVKFTSTNVVADVESIPEQVDSSVQGTVSKTSKLSQVTEDILQTYSKHPKKSNKMISNEKDLFKKSQCNSESKSCSKRKTTRCQKSKSLSSILTEDILRSKSSSQISEEFNKHNNKRTKVENEFVCTDKDNENEEDSLLQVLVKHPKSLKDKNSKLSGEKDVKSMENTAGKSQINTFAMSYHSSGNNERNYSKSVVFRSQDQDFKDSNKLEEILNAREAALVSRKNCVEEWMAWHAKLRAEENRVAQMEQAALKLVTATSNVLSRQDTTVSSDTSDIEGRIEQLTEKLAERRIEMSQLKKEARKQTKQKLRALETNLLNQIKKYDTTIYEMRKKLEFKKGVLKDTDKLAIESKSLADFKVPEIPLKRIQDIYKSSDLLRSRSESDLLSSKKHHKEILRNAYQLKQEDRIEKHNFQQSAKSLRIKDVNTLEVFNSVKPRMTHNDESILDECASEKIMYDKHSAFQLLRFGDDHSGDYIPYRTRLHVDEKQDKKAVALEAKDNTAILVHVDNDANANLAKSEIDVTTDSDAKTSKIQTDNPIEYEENKTNSDILSEPCLTKSISSQSGTPDAQDIGYSQVFSERHPTESSIAESNIATSDSEVLDFSKKLDFLRLNNKNLNENISSLENELKVLSEMMSCFSKKSDEISDLHNDERSTSKDVSDVLSKSNKSYENHETTENDRVLGSLDQNQSNVIPDSSSKTGSKIGSDFSENKDIVEEIDTVMSTIIPDEDLSFAKSVQEIDYRARSKEILKEIEKSIISEHIKSSELEVNYCSSHLENDSISSEVENEESLNTVSSSEDAVEKSKIVSESNNTKGVLSELNDQSTNSYSLKKHLDAEHNQENIHEACDQKLLDDLAGSVSPQPPSNTSHILVECISEKETINNDSKVDLSCMNKKLCAVSNNVPCTDIVLHSAFLKPSSEIPPNNSYSDLPESEKDTTKILAKEPITGAVSDLRPVFSIEGKEESNINFKNKSEVAEYGEPNQVPNSGKEPKIMNITLNMKEVDDEDRYTKTYESKEINESIKEQDLSELEVNSEIELTEDLTGICNLSEHNIIEEYNMKYEDETDIQLSQAQTRKSLESISEQDSSDGEQLDNLVEVTESSLDVIEKESEQVAEQGKDEHNSQLQIESKVQDKLDANVLTDTDNIVQTAYERNAVAVDVPATPNVMNKTFDIVKDPEYEDISEESLEVSEILDRSETQKSHTSVKSSGIPEKYEAAQKSEDVLRILDEISQKHLASSGNSLQKCEEQMCDAQSVPDIKEPSLIMNQENVEAFANITKKKQDGARAIVDEEDIALLDAVEFKNEISENAALQYRQSPRLDQTSEAEKEVVPLETHEELLNAVTKSSQNIYSMQEERAFPKDEQDVSSDFSEEGDTPRGVSEIEMDLPRDPDDSRLDIDSLDDDLLTTIGMGGQNIDSKTDFHATPIVTTSEKDIEIMIEKLKASLEQPGLEVAELEAKLLRIEQLQIELEIKKLEAEEVSYYVREIPNKPPPPYTPPGGVRIPTSLASPSPPPAVIPSNVEELTAFTEKATALIYKAKQAGEDIMNLGAPPEIYQLTKENNETAKKDRRIYNTFLFDLCKETVAEIYRSEYETPGPSWAKPNVKTKPAIKIPRTLDELHDYVCKEVATLFGFKTKLQRENMVMRWSRKRRDRVDELLAREAQAEEDEWTKFHHDESAVKNGLTVAILDTLLTETGNVVKVAYAKKRKIMM
ncbi:hypothetical protein KM043_013569 [Ampulex compressa]|nr:hypothetical protein KM043_013569 [Ampulex compressa]